MAIANITGNILTDSGVSTSSLVSGSGTTNYLPKFTGASALGNSLIFDNGTNVGIGTTTLGGRLDVRAGGTSAFTYYFRNSVGGYGGGIYNTGGNNTQLYLATSAGTENVVLSASGSSYFLGGNVGIGTSVPQFTLGLPQDSKVGWNDAGSAKRGSITVNSSADAMVFATGTSDTERMRITSGGNVEMYGNTLVKAASLTVGNNAAAGVTNITLQNNQNGYQFGINSACTLFQFLNGAPSVVATINGGSGVYTALSDVNKKKDFEESTIGLNEILQLKPTLYRFKDSDDNSEKELGFIAQEVREFIPQAYTESGEGDDIFIGLQDRPIIAALVKAIQELNSKVSALENKS